MNTCNASVWRFIRTQSPQLCLLNESCSVCSVLESCCALQGLAVLGVAAQGVRAKHGLHLSSWTSWHQSPNCCQLWKLHCLFKQFPGSSRFGKQDGLPIYWRDTWAVVEKCTPDFSPLLGVDRSEVCCPVFSAVISISDSRMKGFKLKWSVIVRKLR